jgi:beta-phosphoglucomutase family hydrolase
MIRGALFDMDGVLVDNMSIHTQAFEILCSRYGHTEHLHLFKGLIGRGNDEIMQALFPESLLSKHSWQALSEEKEQIYRELIRSTIAPTKGLIPFLRQLKQADIKCAVGSSACKENVAFVLEQCRLTPYFTATVNGDEVTQRKPSPEIYLAAAQKLQVPAEQCVVFEDAIAGIEAGKRANMHVVALATSLSVDELKASDADLVIEDFTQFDIRQLFALH